MRYGSVCSGIEAASIAWESLGMEPAWFSQFDPEHNYKSGPDFPSAVLAQHWPHVPNLGDMTKLAAKVSAGEITAPDLLVGGTPCQAFSVAGARAGLSDSRGQLTISYGELADAIDQRRAAIGLPAAIIVWENVPGVLSSKDNAFGAFLGLLAGEDCELQPTGKKWSNAGCVFGPQRAVAWRILDAQYFGVAQRRRRVFVVASARADFDPTKVLFELEGVRRDSAPSREAGSVVAALTANGVGTCGADDNQGQAGHLIPQKAFRMTAFGEYADDETASTCKARDYKDATDLAVLAFPEYMSGTQCTSAEEVSPSLMSLNPTAVAIAFNSKDHGQDAAEDLAPTLRAAGHSGSHANAGAPPAVAYAFAENSRAEVRLEGGDGQITGALSTGGGKPGQGHPTVLAFQERGRAGGRALEVNGDLAYALTAPNGGGRAQERNIADFRDMSVRRLTPVECERLQGFPDGHTLIPINKRKNITAEEYAYYRHHNPDMTAEQAFKLAADGPRYKAIGNSMAVPVMRWIGTRIISHLDK